MGLWLKLTQHRPATLDAARHSHDHSGHF